MADNASFTGSIPEIYDRRLGPILFEPYAADMAARTALPGPRDILETAAGTGIVTQKLLTAAAEASIVATDLNQAMLDVAARRAGCSRVRFQQADAQQLPFADASFDAVVCQFGFMFFPDRLTAYREVRRVLRDGGHLLFNVWDRLDRNPVSLAISDAVAALFPEDPPTFLKRVPFGYADVIAVEADLRAAGFGEITVESIEKRCRGTAAHIAEGLCRGSPLRSEIEARDASRLDEATLASTEAIKRLSGGDSFDLPMSAHVFDASR